MARVPRPTTKPASVWPIHRIADVAETALARAFRRAWAAMRETVSLTDLERAYRDNNPEVLWNQPAWTAMRNTLFTGIHDALVPEVLRAATYAWRVIPVRKLDTGLLAFDLINEYAVQWAAREAALLVQQVDAETRKAIRALIVRMQRGQLTPKAAAMELRQIVGLTDRQSNAVYNFRRKLELRAGLITEDEPISRILTAAQRTLIGRRDMSTHAKIDAMVDRYAARQLRYRTENIARTESMTAANRGQQESWRAAVDAGLLRPDTLQGWSVADDTRLCPICRPMKDQTAPLGGVFTNPKTAAQYVGPPAHPSCRCVVTLKITPPSESDLTPEERELADDFTITISNTR